MRLRGSGRAAASAQYPKKECELIRRDCLLLASASEGGSISSGFKNLSWSDKLQELESIAKTKGFKNTWDLLVVPFLEEKSINKRIETETSKPLAAAIVAAGVTKTIEVSPPVHSVDNLISSFDTADKPKQYEKYNKENAVWQGAAQRKRAHGRRTNTSLGVCSVDLAGPFEPTPRPGNQINKNPCYYFIAFVNCASRQNCSHS